MIQYNNEPYTASNIIKIITTTIQATIASPILPVPQLELLSILFIFLVKIKYEVPTLKIKSKIINNKNIRYRIFTSATKSYLFKFQIQVEQ